MDLWYHHAIIQTNHGINRSFSVKRFEQTGYIGPYLYNVTRLDEDVIMYVSHIQCIVMRGYNMKETRHWE